MCLWATLVGISTTVFEANAATTPRDELCTVFLSAQPKKFLRFYPQGYPQGYPQNKGFLSTGLSTGYPQPCFYGAGIKHT